MLIRFSLIFNQLYFLIKQHILIACAKSDSKAFGMIAHHSSLCVLYVHTKTFANNKNNINEFLIIVKYIIIFEC